MKRLDI